MDTIVGALRGLGSSVAPMLISLGGACGLRILWIYTIFAAKTELDVLYLSYPVTWAITGAVQFIFFIILYKKCRSRHLIAAAVH